MRSCCKQRVGLLSEFLNRIDKTNHFNVNTSKKWVNDTFWHLRLNPGRELPGLSLNMLYISRMRWSILNQRMGYYHICKKIKKKNLKLSFLKSASGDDQKWRRKFSWPRYTRKSLKISALYLYSFLRNIAEKMTFTNRLTKKE